MCMIPFLVKRSVFFSFYLQSTLCHGCQTQILGRWDQKANHSNKDHRELCSAFLSYTWLSGLSGMPNALFPLDFFHRAPYFSLGPKPSSISPDISGSSLGSATSVLQLAQANHVYLLMNDYIHTFQKYSLLTQPQVSARC